MILRQFLREETSSVGGMHLSKQRQHFVVRFGFREITGLHVVTAVWYDARGRLFEVSENSLYADENPEKMVYLWFWIDLDEQGAEYPEDLWTMKKRNNC